MKNFRVILDSRFMNSFILSIDLIIDSFLVSIYFALNCGHDDHDD